MINELTLHDMNRILQQVRRSHAQYLFPSSPIEVVVERHGSRNQFAVYTEGEWSANETTREGLEAQLRETVKVHRDLWTNHTLYINPEWVGWSRVIQSDLLTLVGAINE